MYERFKKNNNYNIGSSRNDGDKVRVEIDTTVTFSTYDTEGNKKTEESYETNDPWFTKKEERI